MRCNAFMKKSYAEHLIAEWMYKVSLKQKRYWSKSKRKRVNNKSYPLVKSLMNTVSNACMECSCCKGPTFFFLGWKYFFQSTFLGWRKKSQVWLRHSDLHTLSLLLDTWCLSSVMLSKFWLLLMWGWTPGTIQIFIKSHSKGSQEAPASHSQTR